MCQSKPALELGVPDVGHGGGNLDSLQGRARTEGLIPNVSSRAGDLYVLQSTTALEHEKAKGGHGVGDRDGLQRGAPSEGFFLNANH